MTEKSLTLCKSKLRFQDNDNALYGQKHQYLLHYQNRRRIKLNVNRIPNSVGVRNFQKELSAYALHRLGNWSILPMNQHSLNLSAHLSKQPTVHDTCLTSLGHTNTIL